MFKNFLKKSWKPTEADIVKSIRQRSTSLANQPAIFTTEEVLLQIFGKELSPALWDVTYLRLGMFSYE